jgi:polysaccharide biosynthesis transport protein
MDLTFNIPWPPIYRSLWRMLDKQRRLFSLGLLVLLMVSAALIVLWPPAYKAEATVLVVPQNVPEQFVGSAASANVQERLAAINKQVLSAARLEKIIQSHNLYQRERRWKTGEEILELMRKHIAIELERSWGRVSTGSFKISYLGETPQVALEVTAQIGSFFIEENFRTREDNAQGTSEFLHDTIEKARQRLEELEGRLALYRKQHGGPAARQETSILANMQRLERDMQASEEALARARRDRTEAEAFLFTLEPPAKPLLPDPLPVRESLNPELERARTQLKLLETHYSTEHPDVKALRRLVAELEQQKSLPADRPSAAPAPSVETRDGDFSSRLIALRLRREQASEQAGRAQAERERLSREITAERSRLAQLPVEEQELATLLRDYDVSKAQYSSLLDKRFAAEMAADLERRQKAERFVMIDPPRLPQKARSPNRPVLAVVFGLLSAALALAIALLTEWRRNLLLGDWELPPQVPVLGYIDAGGASVARRFHIFWWELADPGLVILAACFCGWAQQKGWL